MRTNYTHQARSMPTVFSSQSYESQRHCVCSNVLPQNRATGRSEHRIRVPKRGGRRDEPQAIKIPKTHVRSRCGDGDTDVSPVFRARAIFNPASPTFNFANATFNDAGATCNSANATFNHTRATFNSTNATFSHARAIAEPARSAGCPRQRQSHRQRPQRRSEL